MLPIQFRGYSGEENVGKVLLIDSDVQHAERLRQLLASRNLTVRLVQDVAQAELVLRSPAAECEIVVINVSDAAQPWMTILEKLNEASRASGNAPLPLFLCVSARQREPRFELELERKGARYVLEQ